MASPYGFSNGSDARLFRQNTQAATSAVDKVLRANTLARKDGGLIMNAGIAQEAYFRNNASRNGQNQGFWDLTEIEKAGNAPREKSNTIALWNSSFTHKGMFLTSRYMNTTGANPAGANNVTSRQQLAKFERYGFTFHYNPTTINMAYSGIPDIDVTTITSGREAFNLLGTQATQSTITFTIILNRIHDMKYFNTTGRFKAGVRSTDWSGKFPSIIEQQEIYNKGTMYDLEFFLRTVMQVPVSSYLLERNFAWDKKTADIGFLTGVPVELHIGNAMRYLVRVDGFNLTHVIFNERMVPLFTEVNIQVSRIPDYSADTTGLTPPTQPKPFNRVNEPPAVTGKVQGTSATVKVVGNGTVNFLKNK